MAKTDITYAYAAEIVKTEKTPEGLMVYGKVAGPELDLDGHICDPDWLKTAMPEWMKWGNIREQHSPIAAGVGKELEDKGSGVFYLKALVVDPGTIRKVENGVLKGFSPGIKHAKVIKDGTAPNGRIVGGVIVENSLVDRPSNPTNLVGLYKAAGMAGELLPVDVNGEAIDEATDITKAATADVPLTADTRKAALATVNGVLSGDVLKALDEADDIDGAWAAIRQICELIKSEADSLARGNRRDMHDISILLDAVRALECFIDCEEDEQEGDAGDSGYYEGMKEDMAVYKALMADAGDELVDEVMAKMAQRQAGGEPGDGHTLEKAAASDTSSNAGTVVQAEITKAVAEATAPLEAKIESLQADLAKAMAAPIPGGPVLMTQPTAAPAIKSKADEYRAIAARPNLSPVVAAAYQQAAALEEEAAAP